MLSKKAAAISPSATLAINAKAKEFSQAGFKVINFSVGQPDFDTPLNIKKAGQKAIDEGKTKYTPVAGIPELKQAIVDKFKKDNNLNYTPSQIIVGAGGKQILFNLFFALLNREDEVVLPTPAWVSYIEQIKMSGGVPILLEGKKDFKITASQLEQVITPKTKLLLLNSPSNPTGAVYTKKELEQIAEVVVRHNLWVISDEVYEAITFDLPHISIASLSEEIFKKTLVINAVSKTYAMTGWRIGYGAGDEQVIAACQAIQSHSTSNPCSISQWAALEALQGPQDFIPEMLSKFKARRQLMVEGLGQIVGLKVAMPQGAFYVFVDIRKIESDSVLFCQNLIEKQKVACVPGKAFEAEGFVRLSYATSEEEIKEGIKRIKQFVKEEYGR